jgi:heterodisulfide reductase subunit A
MDVRAAGKGYERYVQRAAALPGVTYRWGRPAAVHKIPQRGGEGATTAQEGTITAPLRVLAPDGEEVFDWVVLAVGLGPPEGVRELAGRAGVALDADGFVRAGDEGPGSTSREGVYVAGCALAPADVPEVVTQAAAAAALAARALPAAGSCGTLALFQEGEQGASQPDDPPRVGLFMCTCRGTLAGALDYRALAAGFTQHSLGAGSRAVAHFEQLQAACERSGLSAIERAAAEHGLNRIVVAGCAPRLYTDRFDALMGRLNLPVHLLARANIREGAAWVHPDVSAATAAAQGELSMAIAGLRETIFSPLDGRVQPNASDRVLVLGGGLAGMTAALTLASLGIEVDLLEREAHLGGNLRERLRTLEGRDVQALLARTETHLRQAQVRVWTGAALVGWSGVRGDFTADIRRRSGNGEELCRERYGALIVATGAKPARPKTAVGEYFYGAAGAMGGRVVTQQELERLLAGDPATRLAFPLSSVVMIQCVGSRDEAHPYCSRVCCATAIQNALALKAFDPGIEVSILFRDMRTMGLHERFYQQARRLGVHFLRYEPPETPVVVGTGGALPEGGRLNVAVHDVLYDERVTLEADLLVLSTGIVAPREDNGRLAEMLGVSLDEDGFFCEAHPKLRPTDLAIPGVYLCGLAYGPRTIEEAIVQARAAALRAALSVARPPEPRQDVATVVQKLCSYCGLCVAHCPYGARVLDEETRRARVIDTLCQGCGACVAVCPNGASRQPALEPVRILALVDAATAEEVPTYD